MEDFYLKQLEKKKKNHEGLYKEVLHEVVGKEMTWDEVKILGKDQLRTLTYTLSNKIRLYESPIDVNKLAYAIQHSKSGMGGCAMTSFTCGFCGKEEMWSNTAVPNICKGCAKDMATKIAMYHPDLLKEGVNDGK